MFNWSKKKESLPKACFVEASHPALSAGEIKKFIASVPHDAEMHRRNIERAFQIPMDYTAESIGDLDELIARNWPKAPPRIEEMVHEFGCYLGHTIRRLHGGEWSYCEDCGWTLSNVGGQDVKIYPFSKMRRRFILGKEESLSAYYALIRSQVQNRRDALELQETSSN